MSDETNQVENQTVSEDVIEQPTATAESASRVAQLEQEVADFKDRWMRSAADFKNLKARSERERSDLIRSANAGLLLKLLPVVDDLERAMSSVTPEVAESAWYGGFKLIPQKLRTLLESEGVTPIEVLDQEFDPAKHEAVIYDEDGPGETTVVTAELQRGYSLRDKVLRPAMVKVGKK